MTASERVRAASCDAMHSVGWDGDLMCQLLAGHDGLHDDGDLLWMEKTDTPK
jgi:hypothetical protein